MKGSGVRPSFLVFFVVDWQCHDKPLRLEYQGAVYHVTSRGNAREDIFLHDSDRAQFLEVLGDAVARYGWICHAYCLMTNHYHRLIETRKQTCLRGCNSSMESTPSGSTVSTDESDISCKAASRRSWWRRRAICWNWPGMLCWIQFGRRWFEVFVTDPGRAMGRRPARLTCPSFWRSMGSSRSSIQIPRVQFVPIVDLCAKEEGSMYRKSCERECSWGPMRL